MDARIEKHRRASRWTRDPVVENGRDVVAYLTERDIEIFRLLARYRYLTSDYIYAFVGGNPKALSRRLNLLSRKPLDLIRAQVTAEREALKTLRKFRNPRKPRQAQLALVGETK